MRLLGWSRRLLLLKGRGLSPPPQPLRGRSCTPPSLTWVLIWCLCELIQLTQATRGGGGKERSLGFCWRRELNQLAKGSYEHQPQREGSVLLTGRAEYGFGSFTGSKLFSRFSYFTWLNPESSHWDKKKKKGSFSNTNIVMLISSTEPSQHL